MNNSEAAKLLGIPELPEYLDQVEQKLVGLLSSIDNTEIAKPALRITQSGGKRLRPVLCIASALSRGDKINDAVISAACAIELAHVATLVHDDIIDNSDLRHGISTINSQEGIDKAIIIGDYLLSLAITQATYVSRESGLVLGSAIATICEGQMQETNDEYDIKRSVESYLVTIRKKTASLFAASCKIGGLCANLTENDIDLLSKYGEAFGMAYQLTDDLLDIMSTEKIMGKPVGNDIREGVYTLPILLALKGPSTNLVKSWLGKTPQSNPSRDLIINTLTKDGSIDNVRSEISKYTNIAVKTVESSRKTSMVNLSSLPLAYQKLALKKIKPASL